MVATRCFKSLCPVGCTQAAGHVDALLIVPPPPIAGVRFLNLPIYMIHVVDDGTAVALAQTSVDCWKAERFRVHAVHAVVELESVHLHFEL